MSQEPENSTNPYATPQNVMPPPMEPGMIPPPQKVGGGLAIAALVCGIGSIPFAFCCQLVGVPAGIAAIICGVLYKKNGGVEAQGMAKAGIICGVVGIVLNIIIIILSVVLNINAQSLMQQQGGTP